MTHLLGCASWPVLTSLADSWSSSSGNPQSAPVKEKTTVSTKVSIKDEKQVKKEIKSLTRALSRLFLCSWKAAGLFRAVYRNKDALTSWCSVAGTDVHIGHCDCQVLDRLISRVFKIGCGRWSENTRMFPAWAKLLQTAAQYIVFSHNYCYDFSSTLVSVHI